MKKDSLEQFDILNESGEKTGEVRTDNDAHELGLWHRTVHVWVLNSSGKFLVQKRSKEMRAYPGYWFTSAAGHLSAGQSSPEAAQKETEEELGLSLSTGSFKHLFSCKERAILENGSYVANHINDVYLAYSDLNISEFILQKEEVEEVKWISREELEDWISGKGEKWLPITEEYKTLLKKHLDHIK